MASVQFLVPELQQLIWFHAQSPGDIEEYLQGKGADDVRGLDGAEMGAA